MEIEVVARAALILSALLFSTQSFSQTANCSVPYIKRLLGQTVEGRMTVRTGKQCRIWMDSSLGGILGTRIAQKASAGSATVSGQAVVYVPKGGYTGTDQFTYEREEMDRFGKKALSTVRISVTVIP
jgi:hypothetical protein